MNFNKWIPLLFIFLIVISCKKPFFPSEINSVNNRYLVIEGVIEGGTDSTIIKISRTQKIDSVSSILPEQFASVNIENDANATYALTENSPGIYSIAPINLDNTRKYRLKIKTASGGEYISDYVPVKNSPPIDSVGFTAQATGAQIYVNSHDASSKTLYYRWDFSETWQFHAMYRSAYRVINFDSLAARKTSEQVYSCFGTDTSSFVNVASTVKLASDIIYQAPITTIPATSEKIETKYSIYVKQFVLTADAYAFWLNLQNNTEKLGSIFDVLPSENQSNYHCTTNPNEIVVGYLSVGSTSSKRVFITSDQLLKTYSPVYPCQCELDTAYQNPPGPHSTTEDVLVGKNSPYTIIMGLYLPPPNINGSPTAYTFSTILCSDCSIRGTTSAPSFWK